MPSVPLLKFLAVWLLMLLVSIGNGALREFTYGPRLGELAAHQLSTLTEILLLTGVFGVFFRRHRLATAAQAIRLGLGWVVLTVAFEFLFFHFVGGHSWESLLANYRISEGRVWPLVLIWIGLAPSLFYRLRRHGH